MYEVSAQRVFPEIIPARDFLYGVHRHHRAFAFWNLFVGQAVRLSPAPP